MLSNVLKCLLACSSLVLPFYAASFLHLLPDLDFRGATTSSIASLETTANQFATSVKRRFAAKMEVEPQTITSLASDPRHLPVREQFLESYFHDSVKFSRCILERGSESFICELRNFDVEGPYLAQISAEDALLGVTAELVYRFSAESYRLTSDSVIRSPWIEGLPRELDEFRMKYRDSRWIAEPPGQLIVLQTKISE